MSKTATVSAPGKIILTGEHFVVHGAYSLVAAIDKRVTVTIREVRGSSRISSGNVVSAITANDGKFAAVKVVLRKILEKKHEENLEVMISSAFPAGSGLGSSAATCVAVAAAARKFLGLNSDPRSIFELAMEGERQVHGNPSGVDVEASLQGGLLLFNKKTGAKSVPLERSLQMIVAYSGKARNTKQLITKVSMKKRNFPYFFESLSNASSFLTLGVLESITSGDLPRLGAFLNLSQTMLNWLGVSNITLERMIDVAMKEDVFGAKLTGAGGGGSVIILPKPETAESVLKALSKKCAYAFLTSIPQQGLSWEQ